MGSKKVRIMIAAAMGIFYAGCGSADGEKASFSIYASPSRSHAPIEVSFELMRDDGSDVSACVGSWNFGDGVTLSGEAAPRHTYRTGGVYDVSAELACGDAKGHATAGVEIYDSVDLSVSGLQARPLNITTGGTLNVSVQVANSANVALGVPAYLDIYLTADGQTNTYQDGSSVHLYRQTVENLGKSGDDNCVKQLSIEIPIQSDIRTGAYYIAAVINGGRTIGETSYGNNSVVSGQTVTVLNDLTDGADFKALSLDISPAATSFLSSVTASFRFVNQGSSTDESFRYQIWMGAKDNGEDRSQGVLVHESTIEGGMANAEQSIQNVLIPIAPAVTEHGLYYFWLALNPDEAIRERDMSNNAIRSASPIRVADEDIADADIAVESVSISPSSGSVGGTFLTSIHVVNRGAQPTGSFVCTIFLSPDMSLDPDADIVAGSINIADLPAHSSEDAASIAEIDTGVSPGDYWVYVFCDSSGVVAEVEENNNIQRAADRLRVTGDADIDLVVGAAEYLSSASIRDGDAVSFSVKLCNKGKTDAGPSYISAFRINQCNNASSEAERRLISGLASNACETVTFTTPVACDFWCPNYQFKVTADVTDIVIETRKENNTATLPTITASGPQCVCSGDAYEPNDLWGLAKTIGSVDEDLTLCSNDKDFFKLDVPKNGSYEAHLSHDSSASPLEIVLYHGTAAIASYHGADDLYIRESHYSSADGDVRILIKGVTPNDFNRYHLSTSIYSDAEGIDLAASSLTFDGMLSAAESKKVMLKADNLGSEKTAPVKIGYYLSSDTSIGAASVRLAQRDLPALMPGASAEVAVDILLPGDIPGGYYYLIARIDDENTLDDVRPSNNETHSARMYFDKSCYDSLDPNDSDNARELVFESGSIRYDDLAVCQSNADFYSFGVSHGDRLDISATAQTSGDFDIYLYDAAGNEIASSRTASPTETIHLDYILGDQTLILEVRQIENDYNANESKYSLFAEKQSAAQWLSCSNVFEPNNYASVAYELKSAATSGMTAEICPDSDEDYYRIALAEGDRLRLGFDASSSMLRAGLYRGMPLQFISLLTNLRSQSFDYTATESGDYYIRVFTNATAIDDKSYRLKWLGASGPDVGASNFIAPARTQAGAEITVSFDIANSGDADAPYAAAISINSVAADTFSGTLKANASERVSRKISVPETLSGSAVLRAEVACDGDANMSNNAIERALAVFSKCQDDAGEPNDNILQAGAIEASASGSICLDDEDWFSVPQTATKATLTLLTPEQGYLKITAYDSNGAMIAESDSASVQEIVTFSDAKYIRVKGSTSESFGLYDLKIE